MKKALYLAPIMGCIPLLYPISNKFHHWNAMEFLVIFSIYTVLCMIFFGVNTYRYIKGEAKASNLKS